MRKILTVCAVLALSAAPMLAQTTTSPQSSPMSQDQQTMPSNQQTMPSNQQTMPSSQSSTPSTQNQSSSSSWQSSQSADLTGQTIYNSKGRKIGTVASMSTDSHGQQAAVVTIERYLGMGGTSVLFPVSSLQARSNGGYSTTLTASEIKALPKAGASTTNTNMNSNMSSPTNSNSNSNMNSTPDNSNTNGH